MVKRKEMYRISSSSFFLHSYRCHIRPLAVRLSEVYKGNFATRLFYIRSNLSEAERKRLRFADRNARRNATRKQDVKLKVCGVRGKAPSKAWTQARWNYLCRSVLWLQNDCSRLHTVLTRARKKLGNLAQFSEKLCLVRGSEVCPFTTRAFKNDEIAL